jgi:hypothetical protein
MAIAISSGRYISTDAGHKIFQNVPKASIWYKMLITSATPASIPGAEQSVFLGKVVFDFWHTFMPSGTTTTVLTRFHLNGANGSVQIDVPLTIGVVYVVGMTWDGVAGNQTVWINGVPTRFPGGTITGNTTNNSSALSLGYTNSIPPVVFQIDDLNILDNYAATSSDFSKILDGADPTTIGPGATWRGRWTFRGTTDATVTVGDPGIGNSYGGGQSLASGGDGSDFISASGSGAMVYKAPLVWTPTVEATPYVAQSGKIVVFRPFTSTINGSQTTPSQVVTVPTISVNGNSLGALTNPWFSGYHPFLFYTTPGNYQIQPGDTVTISAPSAWCATPAGSVAALDNQVIDNRSGRSSVGTDTLTKTMALGIGMNQAPMHYNFAFYQPLKNWKYLLSWGNGRGAWTTNFNNLPIQYLGAANGLDNTLEPCQPGLWLAMWDVANTSAPTICSFGTPTPASTTCVERVDLRQRPPDGIGYACVFDVENIPGNTAGAGGSYVASANVSFNVNDPSGNPSGNISNLWIVAPGDWDIVGGVPVLDRSNPWALSRRYLDRMPTNTASIRWLASGPVGGNPTSFPRPEALQHKTDEFFGSSIQVTTKVGFSSFGPVDPIATPYIYSEFLGKPGARGQTYTATLATDIATAPAVGTHETWTISDGATAPLMDGLEMKIDSEIVRIISGSGTSWVVCRGSNGTTPATHSAGPLTVFGRIAITSILNSSGTAPSNLVFQGTSATPHGLTTGNGMGIIGAPTMTFTTGETLAWVPFDIYVTGPNTCFEMQHSKFSSGGKPVTTYTTNPSNTYALLSYPQNGASLPHEVSAIITGQFPSANYVAAIPHDACDDMIYTIARRVRDNLPAGNKVFVEVGNEPWNSGLASYFYHTLVGPLILGSLSVPTLYVAHRTFEACTIFEDVFGETGRASEIVGLLNCQLGGADIAAYLNYAQTLNVTTPLAIAVAPYLFVEATTLNASYVNTIDDEQAIDMFTHDYWYNPRTYNTYVATQNKAIAAYNTATGNNCIATVYEGGLSMVVPEMSQVTHYVQRNHDCITNPNILIAFQDYCAWMQKSGFLDPMLSSFSEFWENGVHGYPIYKHPSQDHGTGDGSDGKFNNLLCRANPSSPNYKGSKVNQEANTVSVQGESWLRWMAAIGGGGTSSPYLLTEDGSHVLLESGDSAILVELASIVGTPSPYLLTEDGSHILLESGDSAILVEVPPGVSSEFLMSEDGFNLLLESGLGSIAIESFNSQGIIVGANLGRFRPGDVVPLAFSLAARPDYNPIASVTPSGAAANPFSRDGINFLWPLLLDGRFTFGTFIVTCSYSIGGISGITQSSFEVVPGGDVGGRVISLFSYERPKRKYVLAQLQAGSLVQGSNPHL